MRSTKLTIALGVLATALAVALPARAQDASAIQRNAARRGLLSDAQAASEHGDHATALQLANRAGQIEMTPSVRLFIAQEQLALSQLVDAYGTADFCVRDVEHDTTVRNRDAILRSCHELLDRIGPQLARIVVHVPEPLPPGFVVRVAGVVLNPAFYGVPYRVAPGSITVETLADGHAVVRQAVTAPAGQSVEVTTNVGGAGVATASSTSAATTQTSRPASAPPSAASSGPGPLPIVVLGVGVAGLIASGVLFALRQSAIDDLVANHCDAISGGYTCDMSAAAQSDYNNAQVFDTSATVALIAGAVLTVGGAAWWIFGRSHARHESRAAVHFGPVRGGAMITLGVDL
jgi:hypothetical protein